MTSPAPSDAPIPLTKKPAATLVSAGKPVFRTYASDVARLTGKPLPAHVKNEPAPLTPRSAIPPPHEENEKKKEVLPTQPVLAQHPVPVPPIKTPEPPPAPHTPAPERPYEPPPASIVPKAPTTKESREEVLERLKARAVPEIPNIPEENQAVGILPVPKAPSTNESREAVLARLRKASGENRAPSPVRAASIETPSIGAAAAAAPEPERIHTYTSDFRGKSAKEGASSISLLAAEQDAKGTPAPQVLAEPPKTNRLVYIAGIFLVLAGIGSIYAAYRLATGRPAIREVLFFHCVIFADERTEIVGEGKELQEALVALVERPLSSDAVRIAYRTKLATTTAERVDPVSEEGGALIAALMLPGPGILMRTIEPESITGVIGAGGETRPFFILRVSSYERSFAGMLEWEASIANDLAAFFPPYPTQETANATDSSGAARIFVPAFSDEVVENRDVRVLRDAENNVVMLYGYRDKRTLIIARSPEAFTELVARLAATASR